MKASLHRHAPRSTALESRTARVGTEGAGMGKRLRGGAPIPYRSQVHVAEPALGALGHGTEGKTRLSPQTRAPIFLPP